MGKQKQETETIRAFVLEVLGDDGEVIISRPSTSRHTLVAVFHGVIDVLPSNHDLHVEISTVYMSPEEFKAKKQKFDEDGLGELTALAASDMLKDAAEADVIASSEAEFTGKTVDEEQDED